MSENSNQISYVKIVEKNKGGQSFGIVSIVVGIISIIFFSFIFSPIAFFIGVVGLVISIRSGNAAGIGMNISGVIAAIIGAVTSPVLVGLFGAIILPR